MRTFAHLVLPCLVALTMSAPAVAAAARAAISATGTPDGFAELETARPTLVDVYFGNQKVGEALADTQPGLLKFRSPSEVLAKLPQIIVTPELTSRLSGELPTNSASVCSPGGPAECGSLAPEVLAIIYDEDRFRVDLFVNRRFLRTVRVDPGGYLPAPTAGASVTSAFGIAAAGTVGGRTTYNLQNRTIIGFENARIRTSNSVASGLGWVVDDIAAEVDRKDVRYSAGLFWAPGTDFTGQRRMIGAGFGTQFDTQRDPAAIQGTPLVLFLSQPARVEILVDGRLVTSGTYAAGNDELDTSALPQGSYDVELRIHEQSGAIREEHRFFVKNPGVPPVGHPVYFGYAGVLANTRANHPIDPGSTLFYQAGAAWRLGNSAAVDIQAIGTQRKAIIEAGGWLIERPARVRLAALASTAGDAGFLLQVGSGALGDLNFNFDLRRIWSGNSGGLIPLPDPVQSFDSNEPTGLQRAEGSYTQAIGSIGLRLGTGNLSVIGSYRKDRRLKPDYSIGPSLNWPVITRNGLQLVLELSGQRTRTSTAAFAGIRILSTSGPISVAGILGQSMEEDVGEPGGAIDRSTGSVAVQYSRETAGGALLTGEVGAERDIRASAVHAGANFVERARQRKGRRAARPRRPRRNAIRSERPIRPRDLGPVGDHRRPPARAERSHRLGPWRCARRNVPGACRRSSAWPGTVGAAPVAVRPGLPYLPGQTAAGRCGKRRF